MSLLIAGLLLFTVVHLLPAVSPDLRGQLVEKLGENAYRGVFSIVIVASLVPERAAAAFRRLGLSGGADPAPLVEHGLPVQYVVGDPGGARALLAPGDGT